MNSLKLILPSLLIAALLGTMVSAQTTRVHRHHDPNLPGSSAISAPGTYSKDALDAMNERGESAVLSGDGDVAQRNGDWETAQNKYQEALDIWPDNTVALCGLAKCAESDGDTAAAIDYYRTAIYSHDPKVFGIVPGDGYQTNDVGRMMDFAIQLNMAGQWVEARKVYTHAAHLLNYQDSQARGGKPFLKVLLPEFSAGPDQVAYTPKRLEAMAHVALSLLAPGLDSKAVMPEIQTALRLYPDSAVAYFYLGDRLSLKGDSHASAAYAKAAQIDKGQAGAAAREVLKKYFSSATAASKLP